MVQSNINTYGWNIGYRSQSYVYISPVYLRTYLSYLWNTYRSPILITEFGFPVFGEAEKEVADQLFDSPRSQYYLSYMSEVLKSIWEDGVEVLGAFAWSFADNWEFGDYDAHFGLQYVNRTTQEKRFKKSLEDLANTIPKDKIYLLQISDAYKVPQPFNAERDDSGLLPRGRWSHD